VPKNQTESADSFNPFIHGTNSLILPVLVHTDMKVMSPIEMIREYGVAPLGGEIIMGGYRVIMHSEMGLVSFGRLGSSRMGDYTLERIIDKYTHFEISEKRKENEYEYIHAHTLEEFAFVNINVFLILLASRRMRGEECLLNRNELDFIWERINAVIQIYYLELMMGKYIHPDLDLLASLEQEKKLNIFNVVRRNLDYNYLANKIIENRINVEDIYRNPSAESLSIIEDLLVLPKNPVVPARKFAREFKDTSIEETRVFTSRKPRYPKRSKIKRRSLDPIVFPLSSIADYNFGVSRLLEQFARKRAGNNYFSRVEKDFENVIHILQDRMILIKSIVENYDASPRANMNLPCITDPFPMILLYEDNSNIHKLDSYNGDRKEYRAEAPLVIGKDIRMIATDTQKNARRLHEFFTEHGIDIEIVLFDQLREARESGKRPIAIDFSPRISAAFTFFGNSIYQASKKVLEYGGALLGYNR